MKNGKPALSITTNLQEEIDLIATLRAKKIVSDFENEIIKKLYKIVGLHPGDPNAYFRDPLGGFAFHGGGKDVSLKEHLFELTKKRKQKEIIAAMLAEDAEKEGK